MGCPAKVKVTGQLVDNSGMPVVAAVGEEHTRQEKGGRAWGLTDWANGMVLQRRMWLGVTRWVADDNWHGWEHGLSWLAGGQSKLFVKGEVGIRGWLPLVDCLKAVHGVWLCGKELMRWRCIYWLAVRGS